jgi:hypothetical protein
MGFWQTTTATSVTFTGTNLVVLSSTSSCRRGYGREINLVEIIAGTFDGRLIHGLVTPTVISK